METVTVRMARGDRSTSWGFGVTEAPNRDVIIVNVVGGSLADRAGLRDGDIIDQLEGLGNLDINAVDRLLVTSRDKIELIVHRPAAIPRQSNEPAYQRSETLRLIKEEEGNLSDHPNPQGLPVCFLCNRPILGVMARAAGHDLHGDCLSCATCGSSLRNVGHHFIEDRFYCDVHGRQKKGQGAPVDPALAVKTSPTVSPTPQHTGTHIHYGTPKTHGTLSPSLRGVPSSVNYGTTQQHTTTTNSVSARPAGQHSPQAQHSPNPPPVPSNPPPGQSFTRSTFEQHTEQRTTTGGGAAGAPSGKLLETRGHGSLNNPGGRIPYCESCKQQIRGAFVLATGLAWCPEHFVCAYRGCGRRLLECGFVEESGSKYCEGCFEAHIAPRCAKCSKPIISDCLNAMQKKWHPTCFTCAHCHKPFGNTAFYLENGLAYCESDWNALFTTKCVSCKYPIEAGDRWVEALGNAFHSNCFNCTRCHSNLEGESFFAKNGQPYCKMHA
uniref:PDZ and LIM domain protein Zasp n=1 Tax=Haemonchus contortus TaxID=6289 RepID=A0A7I4YNP4_HAECO